MRGFIGKVMETLRSIPKLWRRHDEDAANGMLAEAEAKRKAITDRLRALEREREVMKRGRQYGP